MAHVKVVAAGPRMTGKLRPKAGVRLTGPRLLIMGVIEDMGGEVRDEDGGATNVLWEGVQKAGHEITAKSLVNSLKAMEERGLIQRDVKGKRTYAIRLVKEHEGARPSPSRGGVRDDGGDARLAHEATDDGSPVVGRGAGRDGLDYGQLATALLDRTLDVLAREGEAGGSVAEARQRLAIALDESQTYVKKLRDVELKYEAVRDELVAVSQAADTWKRRCMQAESNIESVIKAGGRPLNDRKLVALQRFIAQRPSAKR